MNEKIRELAERAWDSLIDEMGDKMFSNRDTGEYSTKFLHAYDQRFAELIVKECANFADSHNEQKLHEDYNLGVGRAIKEHFGVKE